jgi:hypothetical protein
MRRNDSLLRALVASPHPLPPPQPRGLTVAPSMPLPQNLRFGPANPNQVTNSPFSGAVAGRGALNVVHPQQESMPTFTAPTYAPLTAQPPARMGTVLPSLLTALVGAGAAAPGGPVPVSGATPTPPPPPPAVHPATWTGPWAGQENAPMTPAGLAPLLAALAQAGKKLNPSAGGGTNYVKSA